MSGASLRLAALALLLGFLLGCEDRPPIEATDLSITVKPGTLQVGFGQAFPLEVVRVWKKSLRPEPFREEWLQPLHLKPVETQRREDSERIEETLRFEAYAFLRESLAVPACEMAAKDLDGGPERRARAEGFRLAVDSSLPDGDLGAIDLPGPPLEPQVSPWPRRIMILSAFALGLAFVLIRLARQRSAARRAARPIAPPELPPPPELHALARLESLRRAAPTSAAAIDAFHLEVTDLVRDYIALRFDLRAPLMTTEEFLAAEATTAAIDVHRRADLATFLASSDLFKFAGLPSDGPARAGLLDAAERFVRETAAAPAERAGV